MTTTTAKMMPVKSIQKKAESKEVFLKFWGEPKISERRERPGIYTSYYHKSEGKTLQFIVLDTKFFAINTSVEQKGKASCLEA